MPLLGLHRKGGRTERFRRSLALAGGTLTVAISPIVDSKTTSRYVGEPTNIFGCSMSRRKIALLGLLLGVWILASINATLVAVRPVTPPSRDPPQAAARGPGQRLTSHVLLVIVDGLRWDVANDSATMPQFAAALLKRASSEVWAGRITMTSSAVLAYGTGQRGDLDQILENLHPPRASVNDWLHNAKHAGLGLMGAGDPAWSQLYGDAFETFRPDPQGVTTETDFNAITFRDARELQRRSPDFLVVHFVTPDHQGHAWGIKSSRYASHMQHFDRRLFEWLGSFGPNWTVIVTSDHGAADSGTHGTDTTEQRRCPLFAYGPGIRPSIHPSRALDQVDLPGLLSALLGVPTAQQARGRVPFEWLEQSPETERRLACSETRRLAALLPQISRQEAGDAIRDCCDNVGDNRRCIEQTRQLSHNYDNAQGQVQGTHAHHGWHWLAILGLAALAAAVVIYGRRAPRAVLIGAVWLGCALALTYSVERLSGNLPNLIRALLFLVANACLVAAVIRFKSWASRFERHWALILGVLPGWLLVSYTTNTQIEAYACIVALGIWLHARATQGTGRVCKPPGVQSPSPGGEGFREGRTRLDRSQICDAKQSRRDIPPRLGGFGGFKVPPQAGRDLGRGERKSRAGNRANTTSGTSTRDGVTGCEDLCECHSTHGDCAARLSRHAPKRRLPQVL